jgi:hypothetical protein
MGNMTARELKVQLVIFVIVMHYKSKGINVDYPTKSKIPTNNLSDIF